VTFARGSATTVFVVVGEGDGFDQTFVAQKFGRWLWILPKPQNLTPLHFSTTACEKSHKRSLKCWIVKDWSLTRRARPRKACRRGGKMSF